MGVIACSRNRCENIMCDRQGADYNICNDCFEELVLLGPMTNLEHFFATPVHIGRDKASRAFYDEIFPLREI